MFGRLWFQTVLDMPDGYVVLTAWVIWVVVSITLHELSHGWMAIRLGDNTPINTGHMTFNPVVHMGLPSLIMFALTGIAWGAMPIDPTRLQGRHGDAKVAFAGPAMNFALAAFCIVVGGLWGGLAGATPTRPAVFGEKIYDQLLMFFRIGALLNVALGLFNLLPAPPLDGSRVLASFSRGYRRLLMSEAGGFFGAIVFVLAFLFAGNLIFGVGAFVTKFGMALIVLALKFLGVP